MRDYLTKLLNSEQNLKQDKDMQMICSNISGRSLLAIKLFDRLNMKNSIDRNKTPSIKLELVKLEEMHFNILCNLITAGLLTINQNMENVNFENTRLLTIVMFKYYM